MRTAWQTSAVRDIDETLRHKSEGFLSVFGDYVESHGIKKHILKWKKFSTIIALISDKTDVGNSK